MMQCYLNGLCLLNQEGAKSVSGKLKTKRLITGIELNASIQTPTRY
jgi:hypothetical protein